MLKKKSAVASDAQILIFEQDNGEYVIPLSDPPAKGWLSLTPDELIENQSRVQLKPNQLTLRLPLYGTQQKPLSVLIEGQTPSHIKMPGGELEIGEKIQIQSRQAISLAMWTFIAMVFGMGMTISGDPRALRSEP